MGGVSFYRSAEDGYLARTKGGIDGDRIRNSPEFQRTRENNAEFGNAGSAGKLLRQAFRAQILNTSDSRMASRLTREMMKVVRADATNARGERNVPDGETELLRGFDFNEKGKLTRTFFAPYASAIDRAGGTVGVSIPAFISGNMVAAPTGATHFKLVFAAAAVDFESGEYLVNGDATAELAFSNQQIPATNLEVLLTPGTTLPIFLIFGIEFYQQVNAQMYTLKNGAYNALTLIDINGGGN